MDTRLSIGIIFVIIIFSLTFDFTFTNFLLSPKRLDLADQHANFQELFETKEKIESEKPSFVGYIVVGNEEPLSKTYAREKNSADVIKKIESRRNEIYKEQNFMRQRLESFRQSGEPIRVFGSVIKTSNALFVNDLSGHEIRILQEAGLKVTPNYKLELDLYETVPLIEADEVWELGRSGGQCGYRCERHSIGQEDKESVFFSADLEDFSEGDVKVPSQFSCPNGYDLVETECLTGEGVTIGIIDSGVDYSHPDLGGCTTEEFLSGRCEKVVGGFDFASSIDLDGDGDLSDCYVEFIQGDFCEFDSYDFNRDGDFEDCFELNQEGNYCEADYDPMDQHGHGTHVASVAAGNGDWDDNGFLEEGEGLHGVAKDAKLYAFKIQEESTDGDYTIFMSDVARSFEASIDPNNDDDDFSDHLDIVSMSAGIYCRDLVGEQSPLYYNDNCGPNDFLSNAADNMVDVGIIVVFAAGNNFVSLATPATSQKAISVGNSLKDDSEILGSEGPVFGIDFGVEKPDISAPGHQTCAAKIDYFSADCFSEFHRYAGGTSNAAPHVSGTAALILQAHTSWSPQEVKHALRDNAIDLGFPLNDQGYGRLDSFSSVFTNKPPISSIDTGGIFSGTKNIIGTAGSEDFNYYDLEISEGILQKSLQINYGLQWEDALPLLQTLSFEEIIEGTFEEELPLSNYDWENIISSSVQKDEGILANLDSSELNNDAYFLRLRSFSTDGTMSEDYSLIFVQNAECGNLICEYMEDEVCPSDCVV